MKLDAIYSILAISWLYGCSPPKNEESKFAPQNIKALAGDANISLNWSEPLAGNKPEGYKIYRSNVENFKVDSGTVPYSKIGNQLSFKDTAVENQKTYYYRVMAFSNSGDHVSSKVVAATPNKIAAAGLKTISGNKKITLTWDAPPENQIPTGYKIYRDTINFTNLPSTPLATIDYALTYTDNQAASGITYYYSIVAFTAHGDSPNSAVISGIVADSVPEAPTNLAGTIDGNKVHLKWDQSILADDYTLIRSEAENFSGGITFNHIKENTFIDETSTYGKVYYYKVLGINSIGTGLDSNTIKITIPLPLPGQVTNLIGSSGDAVIMLTWTEVLYAQSYKILRSDDESFTNTSLVGTATSNQFLDSNLTNGKNYYYFVISSNVTGDSSAVGPIKTKPEQFKPLAPSGFTFSATTNSITISWQASMHAVKYLVFKSTSTLFDLNSPIAEVTSAEYTDTSSSLQIETVYYYAFIAVNKILKSDLSSTVSGYMLNTVKNLSITAADGQNSLIWDALPRATQYKIKRKINSSDPFNLIASTTATNYTDISLLNSTTYTYQVIAEYGDATLSAPSTSVSATPTAIVTPSTPTLTLLEGDGVVDLSWNSVGTGMQYQVYRRLLPSATPSLIATVSTTTYSDNTVTNDAGTYKYSVKATKGGLSSSASTEVSAAPSSTSLSITLQAITTGNKYHFSPKIAYYNGSSYLYYTKTDNACNRITGCNENSASYSLFKRAFSVSGFQAEEAVFDRTVNTLSGSPTDFSGKNINLFNSNEFVYVQWYDGRTQTSPYRPYYSTGYNGVSWLPISKYDDYGIASAVSLLLNSTSFTLANLVEFFAGTIPLPGGGTHALSAGIVYNSGSTSTPISNLVAYHNPFIFYTNNLYYQYLDKGGKIYQTTATSLGGTWSTPTVVMMPGADANLDYANPSYSKPVVVVRNSEYFLFFTETNGTKKRIKFTRTLDLSTWNNVCKNFTDGSKTNSGNYYDFSPIFYTQNGNMYFILSSERPSTDLGVDQGVANLYLGTFNFHYTRNVIDGY